MCAALIALLLHRDLPVEIAERKNSMLNSIAMATIKKVKILFETRTLQLPYRLDMLCVGLSCGPVRVEMAQR